MVIIIHTYASFCRYITCLLITNWYGKLKSKSVFYIDGSFNYMYLKYHNDDIFRIAKFLINRSFETWNFNGTEGPPKEQSFSHCDIIVTMYCVFCNDILSLSVVCVWVYHHCDILCFSTSYLSTIHGRVGFGLNHDLCKTNWSWILFCHYTRRLPGRRALVVVFIKNMLFKIIVFVVFECL